ncbi:hypothetical protein SLEP1_g52112 [Rubroshorea leprosula]|uniref:Uncharacterized protein n=1 Tax=Rubroshorea leprosula TaxID=152421 RepID=A0AAV5M592_9ROSI|nr:hypothetical protein SLEP1_g52112 [Rubroshorea leprosula]
MKNSRSKDNLLAQAAMPSVLASTCFNTSNNRFSSKFTDPVSSPRTRGSSSATSASQFLHKPSFLNPESRARLLKCQIWPFPAPSSTQYSPHPPAPQAPQTHQTLGFSQTQIWHFSSLAPDSGYVVLGRESEIELRNPTRKRSRRNQKPITSEMETRIWKGKRSRKRWRRRRNVGEE